MSKDTIGSLEIAVMAAGTYAVVMLCLELISVLATTPAGLVVLLLASGAGVGIATGTYLRKYNN